MDTHFLEIIPIPALKDNLIWCIVDRDLQTCAIVDPGDAAPVLRLLELQSWTLSALLITHHHWDHTGGIDAILKEFPVPVFGHSKEPISHCNTPLDDGQTFTIPGLNISFDCLHIPGHTLGACAYYGLGSVFTGDTLFGGGCGKIFEGTPEMMHNSLNKIISLPHDTQVYSGHEYTLSNLRFAELVEPLNRDIQDRILYSKSLLDDHPTCAPSTIELELKTNPFLRCQVDKVIKSAEEHEGKPLTTPVEVFATLREWKNSL